MCYNCCMYYMHEMAMDGESESICLVFYSLVFIPTA